MTVQVSPEKSKLYLLHIHTYKSTGPQIYTDARTNLICTLPICTRKTFFSLFKTLSSFHTHRHFHLTYTFRPISLSLKCIDRFPSRTFLPCRIQTKSDATRVKRSVCSATRVCLYPQTVTLPVESTCHSLLSEGGNYYDKSQICIGLSLLMSTLYHIPFLEFGRNTTLLSHTNTVPSPPTKIHIRS